MPELHFSVVLTAPFGFDSCIALDSWLEELGDRPGEIIVADSSPTLFDRSHGRVRHLRLPGEPFIGLITRGVREAKGTWALVSEDHCRPIPGIIDNYAAAIERDPRADLIAGGVDNLTSRSPWSFAVFSIGLSEVWRANRSPPAKASNANMLIRRSAILRSELEATGGVLMQAVPRLVACGRMRHGRDAAVDHIVDLDGQNVVDFVFECTLRSISQQREINGRLGALDDLSEAIQRWLGCAFVVPLRVYRNTRNTPQAGFAAWARVAYVCLAVAARLARADVKRLGRRRLASAPAGPFVANIGGSGGGT